MYQVQFAGASQSATGRLIARILYIYLNRKPIHLCKVIYFQFFSASVWTESPSYKLELATTLFHSYKD